MSGSAEVHEGRGENGQERELTSTWFCGSFLRNAKLLHRRYLEASKGKNSALEERARTGTGPGEGKLTISIDARHDNVPDAPPRDRLCRVFWFVHIERRRRFRRLDRAEPAPSRTCITHQLWHRSTDNVSTQRRGRPREEWEKLAMMVAVASPLSPPQHCPMLGHLASSHTVWRFNPRRSFLILL